MTRRERLEAKAERRREWSGKAAARSEAAFAGVHRIADGIPFGQPILVGHHSEKRARKDQERMHSGMARGCEESKLASHHEQKARGLETQLARSIYSDDENAIEALEAKAKACDENAAECNAINRAWRKGGRAAVEAGWGAELGAVAERQCRQFSWLARKGPMSATSDRAEARRCRERIKAIQARQEQVQEARAAGGCSIAFFPAREPGAELVQTAVACVTFAEKPEREILNALRAAGYRWSTGAWYGSAAKLPAEVRELADEAQEQAKADAGECLCGPPQDAYLCVPCEAAQADEGEVQS